mmetsp:Transcript_29750/g.81513  ORF Transcript_29750/g.81513 Transcript_29750/m.81513 type:complete len:223 (-) Transcript_29750:385-1053(-)
MRQHESQSTMRRASTVVRRPLSRRWSCQRWLRSSTSSRTSVLRSSPAGGTPMYTRPRHASTASRRSCSGNTRRGCGSSPAPSCGHHNIADRTLLAVATTAACTPTSPSTQRNTTSRESSRCITSCQSATVASGTSTIAGNCRRCPGRSGPGPRCFGTTCNNKDRTPSQNAEASGSCSGLLLSSSLARSESASHNEMADRPPTRSAKLYNGDARLPARTAKVT